MPTLLFIDGFAVRMYITDREHGPPHVHVVRAGGQVVVGLAGPEDTVTIIKIKHMRPADVQRAMEIVAEHSEYLREQWRKYHG